MEEIAATFDAAGQPDGFHRAAAERLPAMVRRRRPSEVVIDELGRADEPRPRPCSTTRSGDASRPGSARCTTCSPCPGWRPEAQRRARGPRHRRTGQTARPSSPCWPCGATSATEASERRSSRQPPTAARHAGADELWLVTTNDNLDALRLYQRHGFRLAEVRPAAVDEARRQKPQIPLVGDYGIPLRDELVLVRTLEG